MKKETCKYILYKKGNANISTSLGKYAVVCEVFQNKEGRIHIRTVFSGLQPSENSVHEIKFEDGVTIRLGERQSITPSCDFANKPIAVWDIHLSAFTVIYNKNPSSTRSYTLVNFVHEMFTSYEFKIGETLVSLIAQEDYLERVEKIKSREETYLSTATLNFSDCSPEALEKSETICHLISIAQGNIVNGQPPFWSPPPIGTFPPDRMAAATGASA